MRQLGLPLAWPAEASDADFLIGPSNARAVHLLEHWAAWPVHTALLTGPRRSGRSLFADHFATKTGGRILDDADRLPEGQLFHAWNRAQEERRPLLMVAEAGPPQWQISLPDLRSRLVASLIASFDPPDDAMIRGLLRRQLERRRIDIREDTLEWVAQRLPRSHLAVERAVDALEQATLAERRRLSIPFVRATLADACLIDPGSTAAEGEEQ